jgi:catalase
MLSVASASVLFTLGLSVSAQANTAPPEKVTAAQFIDIFEKLGGKYPGFRKAHAKGVCATADFTPAQDSKYFSKADLFSQTTLPAVVRFSIGSANPSSDERIPGVRGMAVQIKTPNGRVHTIAGNSSPVFTGKDPETFFGFLQSLAPDETGKPNPARIGAYIAANPSVQAAAMWSRTTPAPASFANTPYFGLHTFFYQDKSAEKIKYRWHITPDLGNVGLSAEEAAALPSEFLADKLAAQMADPDTTVSFTLTATIGEESDTNTDPSMLWPEEREQVLMGKITLTEVGGKACDGLNFDPNLLSAGFTPSEDRVLRMRSPAYGISFGKRLSNQ